jgi:hypothetical protein
LQATHTIMFGYSKLALGVRIDSTIARKKYQLAVDFSGFDATVNRKLIKMAFSVLRSHFELTESEQQVWSLVESEFINTKFLMPDGKIRYKEGGVPSGSYFTQLIDSIVSASVMIWALQKCGHQKASSALIVLGDDVLFGSDTRVNLPRLCAYCKRAGLTVSVTKTRDDPHFLGGVWERLEKREDEREILTRILYPEKYRVYPDMRKGATLFDVKNAAKVVVMQYLTVWQDSWKLPRFLTRYSDCNQPRLVAPCLEWNGESVDDAGKGTILGLLRETALLKNVTELRPAMMGVASLELSKGYNSIYLSYWK